MPYSRQKYIKKSRRTNSAITKLRGPSREKMKLYRRKNLKHIGSPYAHVKNSGYYFGNTLTINTSVGYIDADHDTVMLDAWHIDDTIMEDIWREDIQENYRFINYYWKEQQGKQFTYQPPPTTINPRRNLYMIPPNQFVYQTQYPIINHQQIGANQFAYQTQAIYCQTPSPFFFQTQFPIIHHQQIGPHQFVYYTQFPTTIQAQTPVIHHQQALAVNRQHTGSMQQTSNNISCQTQAPTLNQGQSNTYFTKNMQQPESGPTANQKRGRTRNQEDITARLAKSGQELQLASDPTPDQTQEQDATDTQPKPIRGFEDLQEILEKDDPLDESFKNLRHLMGDFDVFFEDDDKESEQPSNEKRPLGEASTQIPSSTSEKCTSTFSEHFGSFSDTLEAYDPYAEGTTSDSEISLSTECQNSHATHGQVIPKTCDPSTRNLNTLSKLSLDKEPKGKQ